MFPHRPFRSPSAGAALLRPSRPLPHPGRHRFGLRVARLKDRTLLLGPSGDVLAAVAPKIELGTSKTGTLAPGEVAFFQLDPTTDGRLVARVHAEGATTRLSLLGGQGQVLMQSDGQSPASQDDQIDLHVPAGTPAAQRASFWRDVIQTDPALTVLRRRLRSSELSGTGTSAGSSASTLSNEHQAYSELGTAPGPREGAR